VHGNAFVQAAFALLAEQLNRAGSNTGSKYAADDDKD